MAISFGDFIRLIKLFYSTVSKVLRQKDKYLSEVAESNPSTKRSKGDFSREERDLSKWVQRRQQRGVSSSDNVIHYAARYFAATMGNSEGLTKVNSLGWLEKFKQNLLPAEFQKTSDINKCDSGKDLSVDSQSRSQNPDGDFSVDHGPIHSQNVNSYGSVSNISRAASASSNASEASRGSWAGRRGRKQCKIEGPQGPIKYSKIKQDDGVYQCTWYYKGFNRKDS